jgi:Flp pilus assembly pilin Flp
MSRLECAETCVFSGISTAGEPLLLLAAPSQRTYSQAVFQSKKEIRLSKILSVGKSMIVIFKGSDPPTYNGPEEVSPMLKKLRNVLSNEEGQDIAEYAVMLAVILVLVIGTVRLIGGNANNAFSIVGSTLQGT